LKTGTFACGLQAYELEESPCDAELFVVVVRTAAESERKAIEA